MKPRIVIASVLLTLCFACAVIGCLSLEWECRELIAAAASAGGEREAACTLLARWEKSERLFAFLLQHREAKTLAGAFTALRLSVESGDETLIRESLLGVKAALWATAAGEMPILRNIL